VDSSVVVMKAASLDCIGVGDEPPADALPVSMDELCGGRVARSFQGRRPCCSWNVRTGIWCEARNAADRASRLHDQGTPRHEHPLPSRAAAWHADPGHAPVQAVAAAMLLAPSAGP